jgi:hypothetical protein
VPGYALVIDGKNCNALGAGLKWDGYVFGVARELGTEEWFAFGEIQPVDLYFSSGWNAVAILIADGSVDFVVNGIEEVNIPQVGGMPPIACIGLLASELDLARFDRIYVCP